MTATASTSRGTSIVVHPGRQVPWICIFCVSGSSSVMSRAVAEFNAATAG